VVGDSLSTTTRATRCKHVRTSLGQPRSSSLSDISLSLKTLRMRIQSQKILEMGREDSVEVDYYWQHIENKLLNSDLLSKFIFFMSSPFFIYPFHFFILSPTSCHLTASFAFIFIMSVATPCSTWEPKICYAACLHFRAAGGQCRSLPAKLVGKDGKNTLPNALCSLKPAPFSASLSDWRQQCRAQLVTLVGIPCCPVFAQSWMPLSSGRCSIWVLNQDTGINNPLI
jgi:hypothetical protein